MGNAEVNKGQLCEEIREHQIKSHPPSEKKQNKQTKTQKTNQTKNLSKNKTEKQTVKTVRTFEAGCAIKITTARFILVISFFNLP